MNRKNSIFDPEFVKTNELEIKRHILEVIHKRTSIKISPFNTSLFVSNTFEKDLLGSMALNFIGSFLSKKESRDFCVHTEVPKTWWDAFKLEVLSKWKLTSWFVGLHPVKYKIISTVYNVEKEVNFPEIQLPHENAVYFQYYTINPKTS